jgi:dihydroorotate dehydrogenase (fumarate)/dihydroorotate dehydrogenase
MRLYQDAVRPLLFQFDPEGVHHATTMACQVAGASNIAKSFAQRVFGTPLDARLETTVAGIRFPNPVGLGAGYDKNGEGVELLSRLGFGYIDVGSVSQSPSAGNAARPRLFRIPADEGLMVYYGVPSDGAPRVAARLSGRRLPVPLGVTIVETNTGKPNDPAAVIAEMTEAVAPFVGIVDLLFISAACANDTTGAHPFSDLENLRRLLASFARYDDIPPVFLKIRATVDQIDRIVEIANEFPFVKGFRPGIIAPRPYVGLNTPADEIARMPGTATGPFRKPVLLATLREWYARIDRARHSLIAHGGIRSGRDAYEAIRAGASLTGLVTALIYEGPSLARRINEDLAALLRADGFANVAEAVGADRSQSAPDPVPA